MIRPRRRRASSRPLEHESHLRCEEISKDEDCCIKYVKEVLRGFNHCAMRLGERLKFWKLGMLDSFFFFLYILYDLMILRNSSYQPIVSQDKDTFIRRYKSSAKETHSAHCHEEDRAILDHCGPRHSALQRCADRHPAGGS